MEGFADLLVRPKNNVECAIILKTCYQCNILLTVSAGKTNLTGSATPMGGVILSTSFMTEPDIELDLNNKQASSPVGISLENFRNKVLELSNNTLYYPADPTSRNDAFVGGTLSTNASGFVPGDFHDFLNNYLNQDLSQITAMEYFGYNSQNYMNNKEFLFSNENDVGIYLQIPIYNESMDSKIEEWIQIFQSFNSDIDLDSIIVLNDPNNWKKFFEARHSIPDNALTKTQRLGGLSIITDTIVPKDKFRAYLKEVHGKLKKSQIEMVKKLKNTIDPNNYLNRGNLISYN